MKLVHCLITMSALMVSCGGRLDCKPREVTPTGNLGQDIIGSWDSFGKDSRVVFTFNGDGGVTMVEEPNQFATGGNVGASQYRILDGGVIIGSTEYGASISNNSLALAEDGGGTRVHPALSCNGKGFE